MHDRFLWINEFIDGTVRRLRPVDALCWLVLWRHANGRHRATVAYSVIADALNVSQRTAIRSVDRLKQAGLVRIERRGGLRTGPNQYLIAPVDMATLTGHKRKDGGA